jgi:hypothetical protein
MVNINLGVTSKTAGELKRINSDYFVVEWARLNDGVQQIGPRAASRGRRVPRGPHRILRAGPALGDGVRDTPPDASDSRLTARTVPRPSAARST